VVSYVATCLLQSRFRRVSAAATLGSWLACSADSGAEAERPMHNSEFDQEQGPLIQPM
jgi:hypothetical protein